MSKCFGKAAVGITGSFVLLLTSALGQVRIQSAGETSVSAAEVTILFNATWRTVSEEFHLRESSDFAVPATLVLGQSRDGVEGDETNQVFTIYMSRWDETMFATSVSRIAIQHLLSSGRKARIVSESLRRAHRELPISAKSLSKEGQQSQSATDHGWGSSIASGRNGLVPVRSAALFRRIDPSGP
jgi:hypothetical protein